MGSSSRPTTKTVPWRTLELECLTDSVGVLEAMSLASRPTFQVLGLGLGLEGPGLGLDVSDIDVDFDFSEFVN
jgi:hypothetical protein